MLSVALPQAQLAAVTIAQLAQLMSECTNAMLSVALPQTQLAAETIAQALAQLIGRSRSEAQLTAVTIAQARAAHRLRSERVHKCNAIRGIAAGTAQRCDDCTRSRSSSAAVGASAQMQCYQWHCRRHSS